jgi:hypothetical protein
MPTAVIVLIASLGALALAAALWIAAAIHSVEGAKRRIYVHAPPARAAETSHAGEHVLQSGSLLRDRGAAEAALRSVDWDFPLDGSLPRSMRRRRRARARPGSG